MAIKMVVKCAVGCLLLVVALQAQDPSFHNAPASAKDRKNPYCGQQVPAEAKALYQTRCAGYHGVNGEGTGNIPALAKGHTQTAADGEVFWYVTKGDVNNGMPAWEGLLSGQERWEIVTFVKHMNSQPASSASASRVVSAEPPLNAPPPAAPFTDFRFETPGKVRKITVNDLPTPFVTPSAGNSPKLVPRPEGAKVLPGFKVGLYASSPSERA